MEEKINERENKGRIIVYAKMSAKHKERNRKIELQWMISWVQNRRRKKWKKKKDKVLVYIYLEKYQTGGDKKTKRKEK